MSRSLKRRLTVIVIGIFVVSWLLSAVATSLATRAAVLREIDRVLASVLLVAETAGRSMKGDLQPLQKIYEKDMVPIDGTVGLGQATHERPALLRLQQDLHAGGLSVPSANIWVGRIQLLVGDRTPAFPRPDAGTPQGEAINVMIDGSSWRIMYRRSVDTRLWIAAGVENKKLTLDGAQLLLQMLQPLIWVIPLTGLALYIGITRALLPLHRLAREIEGRQFGGVLHALPAGDAPLELSPVVEALNHLLTRLADTLENEKRFTANAAHELQTPLAAISAEVQLCQRLLTDPKSRKMMERIRARVERASHSVKQLLVLARLDPKDALAKQLLAVSPLVRDVISELGHTIKEKRFELTLALNDAAIVQADREALLILLRNLIGNALRYTPDGGAIQVTVERGFIAVANESEPIADPHRLADRFVRGGGVAVEGTGLGLSIVKRICELHGFTLHLNYLECDQRFIASVECSG